jgi:hypothetical protein
MRRAAREFAGAHRGATAATVELIERVLGGVQPDRAHADPQA